jgi:hypothetical protein
MTNDNRNLNNYFLYSDEERQEVKPYTQEDTEFFAVGNWQFDLIEDDDITLAREAALAWIAWVEYLEKHARDSKAFLDGTADELRGRAE